MTDLNTLYQNPNLTEKDTLFGLPKTKSSLKSRLRRNFLVPWFEQLVKSQVEEDIRRYTEEIEIGWARYALDSDREHKRVHDMQYLCQLKTHLWADYMIAIFHQRFAWGMCCGVAMLSTMHMVISLIKWWIG